MKIRESDNLQAALRYLTLGWSVIPIVPKSKKPLPAPLITGVHMIDVYLRYERLADTRSKTRLDLIAKNKAYEHLQALPQGESWLYLTPTPEHVKRHQKAESDLCITGSDGKYVSAVFVPNILKPTFGYGDIKGTGDAALFIIGQDSLDVLIAKGKKNSVYWLYNLLVDGELDGRTL